MSGLSEYWAYYSGAVALHVIIRKAVRQGISEVEKPKGRKKAVEAVILGRRHTIMHGISVDAYMATITKKQALEAVKDLPLKNPSGCTWDELWTAYKERYMGIVAPAE